MTPTPHRAAPHRAANDRADWEIQPGVDWVDNAFGGVEAELASWRPLYWMRQAFAGLSPSPNVLRLKRS